MALIKCKECGKEISKSAKACPHCGAPKEKAQGHFSIAKIFVVLLGVAFIYSIATKDRSAPSASASSSPVEAPKKWRYYTNDNPVDDTQTHFFNLDPDQGKNYRGSFTLTARCQSNKTEVFVEWRDYLGDDSNSPYEDWKRVIVRVGDAKAVTQRWGISTDKTATFANKSISLLRGMASADKLLLQVTPFNESPKTAIYDTKDLKEPISRLAKHCNWSL